MDVPKRLWDSNLVLSYLYGAPAVKPVCDLILQEAERRGFLIFVSTMAQSEAAYLPGYEDDEAEKMVTEFFARGYIRTILYDIEVAREARRLVSKYKKSLWSPVLATEITALTECPTCLRKMNHIGLKAPDAVHMATALVEHVPVLETTDPDLLQLNEKEGSPPLIIRPPLYEGALPMHGIAEP